LAFEGAAGKQEGTTYGAVLVDLQLDVLVRDMRELDADIAVRCSTLRKYDRGQHMYDASGQGKFRKKSIKSLLKTREGKIGKVGASDCVE
jgi:hypothetical protein